MRRAATNGTVEPRPDRGDMGVRVDNVRGCRKHLRAALVSLSVAKGYSAVADDAAGKAAHAELQRLYDELRALTDSL